MDKNHAKTFLLKRDTCEYVQELTKKMHKQALGDFTSPSEAANVHEECCAEGCDTEEMDENVHPALYSNSAAVRISIHGHAISPTLLTEPTRMFD